jgi:hypothetical protein
MGIVREGSGAADFAPDFVSPLELQMLALTGRALIGVHDQDKLFAACDCGGEHDGRPGSLTSGCGTWAYIDAPPSHE